MKLYKIFTPVVGAMLALTVMGQPVGSDKDDVNLSKIYVKLYGAYGFLSPGSFRGSSELITNEPVSFHRAKTGAGAGLRAGAGIGFILNEFINLGIDGEYLIGKKIALRENVSPSESRAHYASGYSLQANRNFQTEVVSIIPNIVFKAISKPDYYIYNRLGVVVGIPIKMTEDYYQHYNWVTNVAAGYPHSLESRDVIAIYDGKYTLKPSIGYQISLGTQVLLTEKLRGFFEITAYSISFNRDTYEDNSRTRVEVDKNRSEVQQPTVFDNSRFKYVYINSGTTGTEVKGVPNNFLTTVRYAQDPIIMNAITVGIGFAYRF